VKGSDVVSFTGSAETAGKLRADAAFTQRGARLNVEADSVNAAVLTDETPEAFEAFVSEVSREMTLKSGQRCTAVRRAFVPASRLDAAREALVAKLSKVTVGNPRNETVRMGALVNRTQLASVKEGILALAKEAEVVLDGSRAALVDADPDKSACIGPTLLSLKSGQGSAVHDVEVFGPVATLIPYSDAAAWTAAVQRGGGSLVASLYGSDDAALAALALGLSDTHGRVHVVTPAVAKGHTGHGNVMPQSIHGGPGRAGGGEELGGLRGLGMYHRRSAIQGSSGVIDAVVKRGAR
jgi:3,4-dehydroadipyl-CoA semialdehyde dehydrogenase